METSYGAIIGYIKRIRDNWSVLHSVYADQTSVGDYIVEDMRRSGIRNVEGINFTDQSKEAMVTALKEKMRKATCVKCSWNGYVDAKDGEWRTTCPSCESGFRPLLHIPYDENLVRVLNTER